MLVPFQLVSVPRGGFGHARWRHFVSLAQRNGVWDGRAPGPDPRMIEYQLSGVPKTRRKDFEFTRIAFDSWEDTVLARDPAETHGSVEPLRIAWLIAKRVVIVDRFAGSEHARPAWRLLDDLSTERGRVDKTPKLDVTVLYSKADGDSRPDVRIRFEWVEMLDRYAMHDRYMLFQHYDTERRRETEKWWCIRLTKGLQSLTESHLTHMGLQHPPDDVLDHVRAAGIKI